MTFPFGDFWSLSLSLMGLFLVNGKSLFYYIFQRLSIALMLNRSNYLLIENRRGTQNNDSANTQFFNYFGIVNKRFTNAE